MELIFIILILFLGIVFILLEIIVFPGITISGIAGVLLLTLGIYWAYSHHGSVVGHITLGGTLLVAIAATVVAFRYSAWRRVTLETKLEGKIDSLKDVNIKIGDEGKAVSRLAPMGSIKIDGRIVEAKSREGYISEGAIVKVVKIQSNTVIVTLS